MNLASFVKIILENGEQDKFIKDILELAKKPTQVFSESEPSVPQEPGKNASPEEKKEYEEKKKKHDEWENKKKEVEETNKSINDAKEKMKKAYGDNWDKQEIIDKDGKLVKQPSDPSIFKKTLSAEDKAKLDTAMKKFEDIYKESDEYNNAEDKEEALKKYLEKAEKFKNSIIESGEFNEDKLKEFNATSNENTSATSALDKLNADLVVLKNQKEEKMNAKKENDNEKRKAREVLNEVMFGKDGNNGLAGIPIIGFFATLAYSVIQIGIAGKDMIQIGNDKIKDIKDKRQEKILKQREELCNAIKCIEVPDEYKQTQKDIILSMPELKIPENEQGKKILELGKKMAKAGKTTKVYELVKANEKKISDTAAKIDKLTKQNDKLDSEIGKIDNKISIKNKIKNTFNDTIKLLGINDNKTTTPEGETTTPKGETEPKSKTEPKDEEFEITDSDGTKKTYKFRQGPQGGWYYTVIKNGKKGTEHSCSEQDMIKMKKSLKDGKTPKEPAQTTESILVNYISNQTNITAELKQSELVKYIANILN